ncbi:hypothetical protein B296_00017004 [Ensete ventricosum]|uniref:Uncharacterized protein n=1 Tax=Ensete ventricosum TaxID=4639 RepID=A0A426ZZF5_ENSVE|nr:hypothetical protein B296_00017004 [Ensete ventricosum]
MVRLGLGCLTAVWTEFRASGLHLACLDHMVIKSREVQDCLWSCRTSGYPGESEGYRYTDRPLPDGSVKN